MRCSGYYSCDNANVHRGAHQLSARATESFEAARTTAAGFVGAHSPREIVFTRNASEAINLVARSWGDSTLREGDEVLLTVMEHHSNLVPWQLLAQRTGCVLRHVGITDDGRLDLEDFQAKLSERTRLVSLVHISNTLGCCNPLEFVIPRGPCRWCLGLGGCLPKPGASEYRCGEPRSRLLGRLVPQALWSDRDGVPLGAGVAARGDASVSWRRRNDPRRVFGSQHLGCIAP